MYLKARSSISVKAMHHQLRTLYLSLKLNRVTRTLEKLKAWFPWCRHWKRNSLTSRLRIIGTNDGMRGTKRSSNSFTLLFQIFRNCLWRTATVRFTQSNCLQQSNIFKQQPNQILLRSHQNRTEQRKRHI